MGKYSLAELYDIAECLLLDEMEWDDVDFLDDDEMNQLKALCSRGLKVLAEERKRRGLKTSRAHTQRKMVEGRIKKTKLGFVENKAETKALDMVKRIELEPFGPENFHREDPLVVRQLMEALSRRLSAQELAFLLLSFDGSVKDFLLAAVSERKLEELVFYMERGLEGVSDYDVECAMASFFIVAALFAQESASDQLKKKATLYLQNVREKLKIYCTTLPKKLGIEPVLKNLTQAQWQRLCGLTARRDMALFSYALTPAYFEKLVAPLPEKQKKDLGDQQRFFNEQFEKNVGSFADIGSRLKKWLVIVEKVAANEEI